MSNAWRSFGQVAPLVGICIAAFVLLMLRLVRPDRRNRRTTAFAMAGLWGLAVAAITLRPQPSVLDASGHERTHSVNLIPLRSIASLFAGAVDWQVPAEQITGNIALFVPVGVLIAVIRAPRPGGRLAVVVGLAGATTIEVSQLLLPLGRVTSIDDVLLGGVGSGVGWAVTRAAAVLVARLPGPVDRSAR